jgi:hypothetical protein
MESCLFPDERDGLVRYKVVGEFPSNIKIQTIFACLLLYRNFAIKKKKENGTNQN